MGLLFLIYINDFPDCIKSSTVRLFADDSVLYRRINSADDSVKLQEDIDAAQTWEKNWLMSFNASKCQVLRVTNKTAPFLANYYIHDHRLEVVKSAKYLGVTLDSRLNFNSHVDAISKKANSTRAFFSRNLGASSRKIKEAVYTTFVRPLVEYASAAWDPHTRRNSDRVERVQRGAARYVMGDYSRKSSVTSMLQHLQWPTLQQRRLCSRLSMVYRIRSGLVDIPWNEFFTASPSISRTRGHGSRLLTLHCNSSVYSNSFFPRTIKDWNALPFDPASCGSLESFKVGLRDAGLG